MRSRSHEPPIAKAQWQPSQENDRRRSQRLQVSYPGLLGHRDRWTPTRVINLSRHGMRICGPGAFKVGEHVVVEIAAPCRSLQLGGRVVWNDHCRKRMGGIAFDALAREDALALNATLFEARRDAEQYEHDVLVVTEDPAVQLALADGIWRNAYGVAMRTTVDGALAYLTACATRACAVLVSAKLPDRAGQQLLDLIAKTYPAVRRVLLVDNLMDAAHALGETTPDYVLLSPFHTDALGGALRARPG